MKKIDNMLFSLVHDYFKVYLPKQRKSSANTIRAYQHAIESLLDYVKTEKGIRLANVTFEMIDRRMLGSFLDKGEEEHRWSASTRNHRLQCIRSFYAYAANMEPTLVVYHDEILKVPAVHEEKSDFVEHMSETAIKTIWEQPDTSTLKGMRDQFLMMLLYDSAARIQELLSIRLTDIRFGKHASLTLRNCKKTKLIVF